MRSLGEIIEDARSGGSPDAEELKYAVCAMSGLMVFDRSAFMSLAEAEEKGQKPFLTRSAKWQWEEHFRRHKTAYEKDPKDWLGWNNDPANPECLARQAAAKRLLKKVAK
jgi:hypothetical protein